MYTLIVECFSTQIMHIISGTCKKVYSMLDGSVLVLVSFPLFGFFLSDQSLGKTICVHTGNHSLVISLDITHKMC